VQSHFGGIEVLNICQLHPAKYTDLQNMSTNGPVRGKSMNCKNKAFGGNILELLNFKKQQLFFKGNV